MSFKLLHFFNELVQFNLACLPSEHCYTVHAVFEIASEPWSDYAADHHLLNQYHTAYQTTDVDEELVNCNLASPLILQHFIEVEDYFSNVVRIQRIPSILQGQVVESGNLVPLIRVFLVLLIVFIRFVYFLVKGVIVFNFKA